MEQTSYWMRNRKLRERPLQLLGSSQIPTAAVTASSYYYGYESWEERAFAEDSAGHLGGCIWPPRSYSCSFCRREFRSAQALGGHMNVHRRDRARLNLQSSLGSTSSDYDNDLDHHQINCNSKPIPNSSHSDHESSLSPRLFPVASAMDLIPAVRHTAPEQDAKNMSNKRLRSDVMFDISSMRSSSVVVEQNLQDDSACPVEGLDLELRLGCDRSYKVQQKRKALVVE